MQERVGFALQPDIKWITDYFVQILIGGMAGVSLAFILCSIALVRPAAGLGLGLHSVKEPVEPIEKETKNKLENKINKYMDARIHLYRIGCYGLIGMLALLVLPFSWLVAVIIFLLGVFAIILLRHYSGGKIFI